MFKIIFSLMSIFSWAQTSTYIKGPTLYESLVSIVSTGGTTGLTCSSMTNIELTGTSTHNFVLPDALTCNEGRVFQFKNNSTFTLTVKTFGGANLVFLVPGSYMRIVLKDNSTSVGSWFYAQGVYPVSIARDVVTDFVAGAIPFSDGTTLSQNSAALYWDNVNERLGIGTNAPHTRVEIRGSTFPLLTLNGNGLTYSPPFSQTSLHSIGNNGQPNKIVIDSYNTDARGVEFLARHSRGTSGSPLPVQVHDRLLRIGGAGNDGSGYSSAHPGIIDILADGNFTSSSNPTRIELLTTLSGTTTASTRLYVANDGDVSIGSSAPTAGAKLDIQGVNGALVVPRMTTAQKNALTATNGMIVYDTTLARFECYTSAWGVCAPGKPLGEVFMFTTNTCPTGSLSANGAAISRTTYAGLFAVIGTTYGAGDGSTTFNLPNLEGIFVRGAGSQTFGSETYTGTLAAKQNDATSRNGLTLNDQGHVHDILQASSGAGSAGSIPGSGNIGRLPSALLNTTGITINFGDAETRPANMALRYCIVVQ